jgi:hypothetical protein
MPKFIVPVVRTAYYHKEIQIEAETQEEANNSALEIAPNLVFDSASGAEYSLLNENNLENVVLVHLEGGVVQDIFTDNPELKVIVRDFDIEGSEGDIASEGDLYQDENGSKYQESFRFVSKMEYLQTPPFKNPVKF